MRKFAVLLVVLLASMAHAQNPPGYDASKAPQRKEAIQKMKSKGFIKSIEVRDSGVVEVIPYDVFVVADFDTKVTFSGVFFAYGLDQKKKIVLVRYTDRVTGNRLGLFSLETGLEWTKN